MVKHGERAVSVVAEELNKRRMSTAHFHDDCFEKLDIVLHCLASFLENVESLEEKGMEGGLGEDINDAIELVGIG